ncbi:hypothetical protein JAAARDRAFT_82844, partial [Jaapia argillacea MUCL 33604]
CFRCNESGHMMNGCPKLNELLMKGIITKDETGRIIMMDRTRIRQEDGESIMATVERMKPRANFVAYRMDLNESNEGDESEGEDRTRGESRGMYPVLQSQKTTQGKRIEVLDGVYPPPRPRWQR